jgi:hypothetical protein
MQNKIIETPQRQAAGNYVATILIIIMIISFIIISVFFIWTTVRLQISPMTSSA